MEYLVGNNFKFILSGQPSRLEDYECFDDPSNPNRIKGEEILDNAEWDENRKKRWYYFYRPYDYGNTIAPVQKKRIENEEKNIEKISKEIASSTFITTLLIFLMLTNIFFNFFYYTGFLTTKISILIVIFILAFNYLYTENRKKTITTKKTIIKILHDEIKYLYQQKKHLESNRLTKEEISNLFWEDIRELENENLNKINKGNEDIDTIKNSAPPFYENIKFNDDIDIKSFPAFPVIPSWALLQKSQKHSISGLTSSTGIAVAETKIGNKIATWRNAKGNKPLFRLWYIQFLFFQNKNITLVSFYYDFISKKSYSKYIEVYQYTHITNYSYIDEDISHMKNDHFIIEVIKLPKELRDNIFGNEVKKISFSSASGSNYECIIPDKDVTDGLNEWLNRKENIIKADNDYDKIIEIKTSYNEVIATLANESFLLLKNRVNKFSISDI